MKYLLLVLLSLLCTSCDRLKDSLEKEEEIISSSSPYEIGINKLDNSSDREEEVISPSYSPYAYNILNDEKEQVICQGDVEVYNFVSTELSDHGNERDLLAYALLMANKYDYGWAQYEVYDILRTLNCRESGCNEDWLNCLDDKTRTMALEYLLLATESDDKEASSNAQVEYNRLKSEGIIN